MSEFLSRSLEEGKEGNLPGTVNFRLYFFKSRIESVRQFKVALSSSTVSFCFGCYRVNVTVHAESPFKQPKKRCFLMAFLCGGKKYASRCCLDAQPSW